MMDWNKVRFEAAKKFHEELWEVAASDIPEEELVFSPEWDIVAHSIGTLRGMTNPVYEWTEAEVRAELKYLCQKYYKSQADEVFACIEANI